MANTSWTPTTCSWTPLRPPGAARAAVHGAVRGPPGNHASTSANGGAPANGALRSAGPTLAAPADPPQEVSLLAFGAGSTGESGSTGGISSRGGGGGGGNNAGALSFTGSDLSGGGVDLEAGES